MVQLSLLVLFLGFMFYLQENLSPKPSLLRGIIFMAAVIEGTLYLALRT